MAFAWLVLAFLLQSLALILSLHELVLLVDLANDHLNPYDAVLRVNALGLPKLGLLAASCLVFLLAGRWLSALFYLCVLASVARSRAAALLDVTEVMRTLPAKRRQRIYYAVLQTALLVFCIASLIHHALGGMATADAAPTPRSRGVASNVGSVRPDYERERRP